MKKILLFALCIFASYSGIAQTDNAWKPLSDSNLKKSENISRLSFPKEFRLFNVDIANIRATLSAAVANHGKGNGGIIISLPNAEGQLERFEVFEASNFAPELQAQFPEIRAYAGKGVDDIYAQVRMSLDSKGIQTMVFRTGKRNEFMEPYSADGTVYAVYNSERQKGHLPFTCSTEDIAVSENLQKGTAARSNSGELLTFRLAMSCNGEYTTYHGGTVAGALAAINATITRVNGVFENDFGIHLQIVPQSTAVIYTNALTDPYTTMSSWNAQLQTTLTANVGEANYDVGHMFGASGGGGNAGCIGCVCVDGSKGRGITSPADGIPMGDNFDIDYVAHELGHQFGANHTFSHNIEGTNVNVEPGSGSTIMGYAGITSQNIQMHSDDYFVYASIMQVQNNMVGKTCPVRTPLTNVAPVINAGADYTIPKSTPFVLTGSGTDANGDLLTYCWEQNDSATTQTGSQSQASPTKTGGPNWRSYDPVATPTRYFPPLARVVNNQLTSTFGNITTEAVSSVARTLTFALTGRDNYVGAGQTNTDQMVVTVSGTAGPFLVTSPNTNISVDAGSNQSVTWDVAGTTANGVNAQFVDIYLSNDGGFTYPYLLASQVPNDGAETVSMPNTPGTTNRIMVKGYNHVFYDISNTNFTIANPPSSFRAAFNGVAGGQNKTACQGTDVVYTIAYEALGGFSGTTAFTATGQPVGSVVTFSPAAMSTSGTVTMTISNTGATATGMYNIIVSAVSGAAVKTVPLYLLQYSPNFAPVALTSPSNGAVTQPVALVLNWAADANATEYDVQIATDSAFANIITSATTVTNNYAVTGLSQATTYYWRVLASNICGDGSFSTPYSFQTGQVVCANTASVNVPLPISASGASTINSTLTIPAANGEIISDVNVSINITHTYVSDFTVTLISPAGTQVQILVNPCDDESNINAVFDDSGADVVCGNFPAIGGTVKPVQLLSALNGQNSAGVWTLRINDQWNGDGGSLNSWALNICSTQALAVAQNQLNGLAVYPNPNNGTFSVQFAPESNEAVNIFVHDIRGREVYSKAYQSNRLFNESLQLGNAAAGIYLVTIQNGAAKEVRKIVVQ